MSKNEQSEDLMAESIAYVNGEFVPESQAKVSVFDRGFLMADAVYEVCAVVAGKLLDNDAHLQRLARSLRELKMSLPVSFEQLRDIQQQLMDKNALQHGEIYLQVTRGAGARDFVIDKDMSPTLVLFVIRKNLLAEQAGDKGLKVLTQQDIRWLRRDIKTTQLLAQSLAKTAAIAAGFDDAWMVDGAGYVTEGSANNAYIVKGKEVITRPANHEILNGITRQTMFRVMTQLDLTLNERAFTPEEAYAADEAFITSAGYWAKSVVSIDGQAIGTGAPGPVACALREAYLQTVLA